MVEEAEEKPNYYLENYDFSKCQTCVTGKIDKADVVAAIQATYGNMAAIGRLLSKTRSEIQKYIDADKELRLLVADQREGFLDDIELKAINVALAGDTTNQRFFLQTLGKNRGYTTKSDSNVTVGVDSSMEGLLQRIAESGKKLVQSTETE